MLGVSQEIPALILPGSLATMASHWSLVRSRIHYPSDVIAGLPRRVPVGNGLRGNHFWIVTEHGYGADYVKNLERDARMRVSLGRTWHRGTAHILPDDDALERLRWLRRPVNDALLLLIGTQQLTIRVDLEPGAGWAVAVSPPPGRRPSSAGRGRAGRHDRRGWRACSAPATGSRSRCTLSAPP